MKKRTKKPIQVPQTTQQVNAILSLNIYDWSETLTFQQLSDTVMAVNTYLMPSVSFKIAETDREKVKDWLQKNDLKKFASALMEAAEAQQVLALEEAYAKDIQQYPARRRLSH